MIHWYRWYLYWKWMIEQRRYIYRRWSYLSVVSWLLFMTCKILRQSVSVSVSSPLIGWRDSTGVCRNSLEEKSFEGGWVVRLWISNYSSKGFKLFIQGFQAIHPSIWMSNYSSQDLDFKQFIQGFWFPTIHPRIPFLNHWPEDSEDCKNPAKIFKIIAVSQGCTFPESLIFPSLPTI